MDNPFLWTSASTSLLPLLLGYRVTSREFDSPAGSRSVPLPEPAETVEHLAFHFYSDSRRLVASSGRQKNSGATATRRSHFAAK